MMLLEPELVADTLDVALATGGDFAEVFVEDRRSQAAVFDDGRVEELQSSRSRGAGIRVVAGETTGFAHTADLSPAGLAAAAAAAAAVARAGAPGRTVEFSRRTEHSAAAAVLHETVDTGRKVELLARADAAAREAGSAVQQVMARYNEGRRLIQIATSDGIMTSDDQVRTLFAVQAVARGDTGLQTGRESVGRTVGFELFDQVDVADIARTAARRALLKLDARPAPSGAVPVVIGRGGGGILFHEACGHGLEADLVAKDASVFAGRMGELVASPLVTLVDDGTMDGEWGRIAVDDEGHEARRNVLISDGRLTDYMWDRLRASAQGRASSGNGRRQSYRHLPMVRMTNTYVLAGTEEPEEIIAQTPYGVYVAELGGGQVNTTNGDFVFGTLEAYLIEDGRLTTPLRDANLIGNGPEVLANIDVVGHDFAMGAPGTCGKDGQGVPVGDGQPTLRVASLTVGGTAA
jgi:TldD protein